MRERSGAALDVAELWAPTPERRLSSTKEKKLALENCRAIDPKGCK